MFNHFLKKQALKNHEDALNRYIASYSKMSAACNRLYTVRNKSVTLIHNIETVINSIAFAPGAFDTELGRAGEELKKFRKTAEYANEAYNASMEAGVNIVGGVTAGVGIAAIAPTALMSIATTFGTAATGTVISALSGAAAQSAALAWIGRTFAGFAVTEGAGMAAGEAILAMAGPIGWGITAVSACISLISLSGHNKDVAVKALKETLRIEAEIKSLHGITEKVNALRTRTERLYEDMDRQREKIGAFLNADYLSLGEADQLFLGSLVNNTLSLSALLNETVSC